MKETRKPIKPYFRKIVLESIFKALLYGLIVSAVVLFSFFLACHIALYEPSLPLVALIGGGTFLFITAVCLFVFMRPGMKDAARRMDRAGLKDKTLTMLELEKENTGIAEIQRRDAINSIASFSTGNVKMKITWVTGVVLAVSLVLATGMYFFPYFYPDPVEVSAYEQMLDSQYEIINELLDELASIIENADVSETLRTELWGIMDELSEKISREDSTSKKVAEIMQARDEIIKKILEYKESAAVAEELKQAMLTEELGEALEEGDPEQIKEALENMADELDKLTGEDLEEQLKNISAILENAVKDSEIDGELSEILRDLAEDFEDIANETGKTDKQRQTEAREALEEAGEEITDVLHQEQKLDDLADEIADAIEDAQDDLIEADTGERPSRQPNTRQQSEEREPSQREPGEQGEQGEQEPGEQGEQGEREPGEQGEQGELEPGEQGEQGELEPGEQGEQGEREPGEQGEQEPGEQGEQGEREPGEQGEQGEREPGEQGEQGEREPGEQGEQGEREPGEQGEQGEREPGEQGEQGEREPGEQGEQGEREPGEQGQQGGRPEGNDNDDDNRQQGDGRQGSGDGDVVYGSNEKIYDPDTGKTGQYGDSLNKYYMQAATSYARGEISEAEWNAIYKYFVKLYNNDKLGVVEAE